MERDNDQNEGKEDFQRTAQKSKANQEQHLIQSKYELNDHGKQQQQDTPNRLDEIQAQINTCEKRLRQIQLEQLKETDKYSENYLKLEQERASIKKRVIDLGFQHRVQIANNMRQSRKRQEEEKQKLIKQAEQQRQRRKKEIDQRLEKQKQERQNLRKQQEQGKGGQTKPQDNKQDQKNQNEKQQLLKSRRRARIAQIEVELAQSRLRRSRISSLNAELQYLRASYSYPYWSWRDYYPYTYAAPALYPYYPYSSLYSYPSLYPYRYRWWL